MPKKKKTGPKNVKITNPYQNVPVKSNNVVPASGFGFPGSVY